MGVTTVTCTLADTSNMGSTVWISDCDSLINGLRTITIIDSTRITLQLNYDATAIDDTLLGDVRSVSYREVFPLDFFKTKYNWKKEKNEIFFRKELNGDLLFIKSDYNYFIDYILTNKCCENLFVIEKYCSGTWLVDFKGSITHNMCEWNLSLCQVSVTPEINDDYSCIKANESKAINIIPEIPEVTVKITPEITIETFTCCNDNVVVGGFSYQGTYGDCADLEQSFSVDTSTAWIYASIVECNGITHTGPQAEAYSIIKTEIEILSTDDPAENNNIYVTGNVCTTYIREVITTIDIGGSSSTPDTLGGNNWVELESTTIGGYPATKWSRSPTGCPAGIINWVPIFPTGFTQEIIGDCEMFRLTYPSCYEEPGQIDYTHGRDFGDVLSFVVRKTCGKITGIVSDFFEINPVGDTPGYVAGQNYVTGDTNKLKNMVIYQKSDFIDPAASNPATIGEISWKEIAQLLYTAFNAYWFIDEQMRLRIEHISWFTRSATITTVGLPINRGFKRFKYDRPEIPKREKFLFMEALDVDFLGLPVEYDSLCSSPDKTDEYSVGRFTTDVNTVYSLPSIIDNDGFVLVCIDQSDNTIIDREVALLSGVTKNNAHLSWANLQYNYLRYNRPLLNGIMNNIPETFITAKRTKRQTGIKYTGNCCTEIDPLNDLITSELGDGQIDKIEKINRDETYNFELLFED
jgi:hypothetical protein